MYNIFSLVAFFCVVPSVIGVEIFPNNSELVIKRDDSITLNCSGDGPVRWSYLTKRTYLYNKKILNSGNNFSELSITSARYSDTGYYICQLESNASDSSRVYIYSYDARNPLFETSSYVNATMYANVIIPCITTSPNISVTLTKMNTIVEPVEKYDPKIGFVISTYPIVGIVDFTCIAHDAGRDTVTVTVNVNPPLDDSSEPYIEVTDPIVEMQKVILNCSIIISNNLGIKSMEWDFPPQVGVTIIKENITEIKHTGFSTFFQTLEILNLTRNNEGNYSCRVVDGNSKLRQFTHSLHIIAFNSTYLNLTAEEKSYELTIQQFGYDSSVEFVASVNCYPKCKITWYSQKYENLGANTLHLANNKYRIIDSEHESRLRINRINQDDFGTYQIRATNPFHERNEEFNLILKDATRSTQDHSNTISTNWPLYVVIGMIILLTIGLVGCALISHLRRLSEEKNESIHMAGL